MEPLAEHASGAPPSAASNPDPVHNVGGWIRRWAARRPERPAWADDHRQANWREAERSVQHWVGWLRGRGVEPGDRVVLWLGNRLATLEAFFAIARVGAIALPLNARLTPAEIAFQFGDARPRLVLVDPEWRSAAREAASRVPGVDLDTVEVDAAHTAALARGAADPTCLAVSPEAPLILMYTSGTTGAPKGALLPHRKALYNSLNAQLFFDLRGDDRMLVVAPLFHSLGLQILALPTVYAGAAVRLRHGFDADGVWDTIEAEQISVFGGVPTMHQRLLERLDARARPEAATHSLRFVFTAGAAAPRELIEAFHERGVLMKQGYGQTETSVLTCLEPEQALTKAGSVGRPVFHATLRLIAPETLDGPVAGWRDAAVGEVGEVVVRGPITMLGYWERAEETAATLREGWVRTGDLATRDADFDVTLVGRAREMYISGGENVYPAEVEAALVAHPDISEAAVVAIDDPEWGEVGRAHLVARTGVHLEEATVERWLADRLAAFKRPRCIVFEASLPRTASGKVQKHRLQPTPMERPTP